MKKNSEEKIKNYSLAENIYEIEILIKSLNDKFLEEDTIFNINKKLMTKEEMKNNCSVLREKINKLDEINKTNQTYYNLQNEIVKGIVELEFNINYYIENGNLYNLFKEKIIEISKIADRLNVNDEVQLKLLMNRYDNYLIYAKGMDINIYEIKNETEKSIARSIIKYNIK